VELVHEALIGSWNRLQGWIEADRTFRTWQERLRATMRQWEESGRDEGVLLRGVPLAQAEEWLAERHDEVGKAEREFIETSIALRERRKSEREAQQQSCTPQGTSPWRSAAGATCCWHWLASC
jgi:hypothetical protein